MIPVQLTTLVINELSEDQVICLREQDGPRELSMVIGVFEAFAIDQVLKEERSERPLTHDLLAGVIHQLNGTLSWIVIDELREETFFAKVVIRRQQEEIFVDARPSDAVALALKLEAPIYVSERVMNAVCSS